MSVYFLHTGYADQHVDSFFRTIKKFTKPKKNIHIVGRDFNAELVLVLMLNASVVNTRSMIRTHVVMKKFVVLSTIYKTYLTNKLPAELQKVPKSNWTTS